MFRKAKPDEGHRRYSELREPLLEILGYKNDEIMPPKKRKMEEGKSQSAERHGDSELCEGLFTQVQFKTQEVVIAPDSDPSDSEREKESSEKKSDADSDKMPFKPFTQDVFRSGVPEEVVVPESDPSCDEEAVVPEDDSSCEEEEPVPGSSAVNVQDAHISEWCENVIKSNALQSQSSYIPPSGVVTKARPHASDSRPEVRGNFLDSQLPEPDVNYKMPVGALGNSPEENQ